MTALVNTQELLAPICEQIEAAGIVGFDTEFHGERFYAPRLMIAQVAIGSDVSIIDAVAIEDLRPLARALSTVEIVGHALGSDLKIFADRFELLPRRAFDTQLAAAFCGYGMAISLGDLIHSLLGIRLRKAHTVSDWSARPLSDAQLTYLVDDVAHLGEVHKRLSDRLRELKRESWYDEEAQTLVELAEYRPDPERLYLRISGANRMNRRELGILREIAQLRDTLARERDVPPKYIIPDDAMASLVHLRPVTAGELSQLRRIDAGMRKAFGEKIVEAIARGVAVPENELPVRPQRPSNAEREGIASLLSVLVQQIAVDYALPSALLAPRAALERIARELPASRDELARLLTGDGNGGEHWRAGVIAEPLWSLLHGHVGLRVEGSAAGSPRVALDGSRRGDS